MGLLDSWTRRALERRAGKVEFSAEHSGIVEETFKRDLLLEFVTRPDIRRAYLSRVTFDAQPEPADALCIVSDRPQDRSLVIRIGEILRRRFNADVPLEVLFLTPEQEREIAAVARPFYSRPG